MIQFIRRRDTELHAYAPRTYEVRVDGTYFGTAWRIARRWWICSTTSGEGAVRAATRREAVARMITRRTARLARSVLHGGGMGQSCGCETGMR